MTRDRFEGDLIMTDFRLVRACHALYDKTRADAASMKTAGDVLKENTFKCLLMK